MDVLRLARVFRAVRIRRRWRQQDLARAAGVSVATIRRIEHGQGMELVLETLLRVAQPLEIRIDLRPSWRGGELDRMLNAGHAAMHERMAALFATLPAWAWAPEVSFAIYGERGVIDILAFHAPTGMLLVIELKTELVDVQELLGVMDRRRRLARRVAAERGWAVRRVSGWIVADTPTNRRRVAAHAGVLRHAFAADGRRMRRWLREPGGEISALSFLSNPRSVSGKAGGGLPKRVRIARGDANQPQRSVAARHTAHGSGI